MTMAQHYLDEYTKHYGEYGLVEEDDVHKVQEAMLAIDDFQSTKQNKVQVEKKEKGDVSAMLIEAREQIK